MDPRSPLTHSSAVYADYNGTTPVDPRVADAMMPFLTTHFGNPSSAHDFGAAPAAAVRTAREQVAALVGASASDEIVFTGSGTEADHLAIRGVLRAVGAASGAGSVSDGGTASGADSGTHLIVQATEHPAVLAAAEAAVADGADVTILPVGPDGLVDPAVLAEALRPETVLVSIMHANNETGAIQPIRQLADAAHAGGALFHTDAAQSVGKVSVDVDELGADLLTVVGHKMYAPKGVAALYVRSGAPLAPLLPGGGQEGGLRGGTENVAGIAGFGEAARLCGEELEAGSVERMRALRDRLAARLEELLPGRVRLNGPREQRLPQTLNVSIDDTRGMDVLAGASSVAASTGSACHAGADAPSPVLSAMGVEVPRAMGALRLSQGRWTTPDDVERLAQSIAEAATGRD
ncbi:cysteine desulfurase family protein [Brevibacterium yomogidense]|uniref:cysteine desulfurase family protein n=1 Tax=Brevibacterium yomogidense TaxID=946573 RepID=UPI0018DFEC01|nr:cysteine desulfurase family protein [Brevibacterium yomogidense]